MLINDIISHLLQEAGYQVITNFGYPDYKGKLNIIRAHFQSYLNDAVQIFRSDMLIIGGGNLVLDASGVGSRWAIHHYWLSLLARLFSKHYYYLSIGATPLQTRLARFLYRLTLRHARRISARDSFTKTYLQQLTGRRDIELLVDPVVLISAVYPRNWSRDRHSQTIGICPVQLYPAICNDFEIYQKYIDLNVKLIRYFLDCEKNVCLFLNDRRYDREVFQHILNRLPPEIPGFTTRENLADPQEYLHLIQELDFLIASRMHAAITATSYGIPCIGYGWQPKTEFFFSDQNLDGYIDLLDRFKNGASADNVFTDTIHHYEQMKDKPVVLRSKAFPLPEFLGLARAV